MHCASSITVTRGTATGSETAVFVEAPAGAERVVAARAIADLLSAMELEGIKHGWPLEYAKIRAEMLLQDWGFERLIPAQQVAQ